MILDGRTLPDGHVLETTVCIAGAGAAGITLAHHLTERGVSVCLVESGGLEFDAATQALSEGRSVGLPCDPQSTRFRFFGGCTNAWGGLVKPPSDHCFEPRAWMESEGWPIPRNSLDKYYDRAMAFLGASPRERHRTAHTGGRARHACPLHNDEIETRFTPRVAADSFIRSLRPGLKRRKGLHVLLNANLVEVGTSDTADRATAFRLRTLCGKTLHCKAGVFVLALGCLENTRVLLLSREHQASGLGNGNGLVGRYFMDHPRIRCGRLLPSNGFAPLDFYDPSCRDDDLLPVASLNLPAKVQKREKLGDHRMYLVPVFHGQDSEGFEELRWLKWKIRATGNLHIRGTSLTRIARDMPRITLGAIGHLFRPRSLFRHYALTHIVEPQPCADSRVTLCDERDSLGYHRVCVDWRLGGSERRTVIRAQETLARQVKRLGLGRVKVDRTAFSAGSPAVRSTWHHMGTTRMDPDPRRGVVDTDCRLHAVSNLYIAGSSVFPVAGDDAPTLTIAALAIRLADHIAARLR